MRFYTINAIAKGEYESVPDEQGMWVSRTTAEARIRELEAQVARYESNAYYQSGYHAAEAVCETRIRDLEAALRWTWDNSKLLESAIPVPSSILKTYRSLRHTQSDREAKHVCKRNMNGGCDVPGCPVGGGACRRWSI